MNYKHKLQEILQKKGYPIPIFDSKSSNNGNQWIGIVKIIIDKNEHIFEGKQCNNKKESQQDASDKAIQYYNEYINKYNDDYEGLKYRYKNNISNCKEVLFIDIENTSKYDYINSDAYIFGFISNNSVFINKVKDIEKYLDLYIYKGKEKDGADILLSMIVYKNKEILKDNKKAIIYTKDHFAECIKRILENESIYCEIKK